MSVPEGVYQALQLFCHEITLQKKNKRVVRSKDYYKIKKLKLIVYLFTFLCLTCAKECFPRMCPLCTKELHLFPIFGIGLGASFLTSNIQTKCQQKQFQFKKYEMKKKIEYELKFH